MCRKVLGALLVVVLLIAGATAMAESASMEMDLAERNYRLFLEEIGLLPSEEAEGASSSSAQTPELGDTSLNPLLLAAVAGSALCATVCIHKKRIRMQ